jgi:hypothetical protein
MASIRLPTPVARYLAVGLRRLGDSIATTPIPAPPQTSSPRVERARAALADARQQMPGLLGLETQLAAKTDDHRELEVRAEYPATEPLAHAPSGSELSLARVSEIVLTLEEERNSLRAEVAALRMIAEELRESLLRLDERSFQSSRDSSSADDQELRLGPPLIPPEPIYPSGSIGVAVHLTGVESPQALNQLRAALERQPEIDGVRTSGSADGEVLVRVYLRFPLRSRAFLEVMARAAPTAKPLAGPAPGSLLLRLRPG